MSAEQVGNEFRRELDRQGHYTEQPLALLFEGFDTQILLDANEMSHGRLFQAVAEVVIRTARHRAEKMRMPESNILLSDFIPALGSRSDLVGQRSRYEFGVFSDEVEFIIRQCCPWC